MLDLKILDYEFGCYNYHALQDLVFEMLGLWISVLIVIYLTGGLGLENTCTTNLDHNY